MNSGLTESRDREFLTPGGDASPLRPPMCPPWGLPSAVLQTGGHWLSMKSSCVQGSRNTARVPPSELFISSMSVLLASAAGNSCSLVSVF